MDETKTIKKISKINIPITILQVLCLALIVGVLYHYGFSPAAKAVETTYSSIHDVQISDAEAALEAERYREYGYSETQLDVIRQDVKNGIDVSKYTQKGQSIDEFISARESVIESYDRIDKLYEKNTTLAILGSVLCSVCLFWIIKEKIEKYERYLDEVE